MRIDEINPKININFSLISYTHKFLFNIYRRIIISCITLRIKQRNNIIFSHMQIKAPLRY